MLRVRGAAAVACTTLLLCACTGDPGEGTEAEGETAVLGSATERDPRPTPAATPTPEAVATPEPTETGSEPEWVRAPATETPEPVPTQRPASTPEQTAPPGGVKSDPPDARTDTLSSGPGWSMNTLLPDDDGEGWTEVGGQPPVDAGGASAERLFAELEHEPTVGDEAGRSARCRAWVEASNDPLQLHGEVVVELVVGDDAVGRSVHELDLVLPAGQRHDLPAWHRAVRLHAAEGQTVTCSVWFFGVGD